MPSYSRNRALHVAVNEQPQLFDMTAQRWADEAPFIDTSPPNQETGSVVEAGEQPTWKQHPPENPDRTSEAAKDQGWGPFSLPSQVGKTATHASDKKPIEIPGQNRGRTNSPIPSRSEILYGMSPEDKARQAEINSDGIEAVKADNQKLLQASPNPLRYQGAKRKIELPPLPPAPPMPPFPKK